MLCKRRLIATLLIRLPRGSDHRREQTGDDQGDAVSDGIADKGEPHDEEYKNQRLRQMAPCRDKLATQATTAASVVINNMRRMVSRGADMRGVS